MIKVYLLESSYNDFAEILLYSSEMNSWLGVVCQSGTYIEEILFTPKFWEDVENGQTEMLTYLGEI